MKKYFAVVIASLAFACNGSGDPGHAPADSSAASTQQDSSSRFVYNFTDSLLQTRTEDTLMQLPFVKETNRYIDSISHHKKGIAFITDTANHEISVMAGYNGAERFEPYYHFRLHPRSFEIKVLDEMSGEFIPVADYLKKNADHE